MDLYRCVCVCVCVYMCGIERSFRRDGIYLRMMGRDIVVRLGGKLVPESESPRCCGTNEEKELCSLCG